MKTLLKLGLLSAVTILAAGCATAQPPQELVDARAAYARASSGPAAQSNPADLHVAKETLDKAEAEFKDNGDAPETKDEAYVALRRSELAESRSRVWNAEKQRDQIAAQSQAAQAQALQTTSAQLQKSQQQLAMEQQARADAEKRAQQAAADLAKIASVKTEARGMVITLSGSVLFATAKWDLLPGAQSKLDEVAKSLTQQDKDSSMTVEGYTDSQGALAMNQELSQKRADAVRNYLTTHGIASDRIDAKGMGPSNPIADNNSPEGRANNRRVEIIVHNKGGSMSSGMQK